MCAAICRLGGKGDGLWWWRKNLVENRSAAADVSSAQWLSVRSTKLKSFGELIARRREELGLTQTELAARIRGRSGEPVSQQRITDIEHDRFGVPRRPILKQLARALKLDIDVLYLWGRVVPPDIRAEGLPEETIKKAWMAFRSVIERQRKISRRGD
jgi:transcriptional regulator with XRE-family HTH domain